MCERSQKVIIKSFYENKMNEFNDSFKLFGLNSNLIVYDCPFGKRRHLIPIPVSPNESNKDAVLFIDDYNTFIALNRQKLNENSLFIMNANFDCFKKNIKAFDAVKVTKSVLPHQIIFILRTSEKDLIEIMPILMCYESLSCPKYYSIDENNKCIFYFEDNNLWRWKLFLRDSD